MPIKSFRGLIGDNSIDTISLHTNTGAIGYRITKFQIMGIDPASTTQESLVKIYKVPQTTATTTVDLSDQTLLAVAYRETYSAATSNEPEVIIFDNEVFNQDLYVTHQDANNAGGCNYYFELEQIKLDLNENTVATLKDIRNVATQAI